MTYRLSISRAVRTEIDRLPGNIRQRVRRAIAQLAQEPRPEGAKPLEGELTGYYRIRLDDYRIIYRVEDDEVLVEIVRVAQRTSRTYLGFR